MQVDHHKWDEEIVSDLFNDRNRDLILGIPLSNSASADCWSWSRESSRFYTVKSAYRWLQQMIKYRQLFGRHFEESIMHILVHCPFARLCWNRSAVNYVAAATAGFKDWFAAVASGGTASSTPENLMVALQIWNARNEVLWQGKTRSTTDVVLTAKSHLNQWLCAQKNRLGPILIKNVQVLETEHWTKHVPSMVKVNVDGAIFESASLYGAGFIARDSHGQIVEAVSMSRFRQVSPEVAEAYGIKEALSWIKGKNWKQVVLESDCLVAVQGVHSSVQLSSIFGLLLWECKQLLNELENISLSFVKRSTNKVGHFLVRSFCYLSVRVFHADDSLLKLLNIVMADSLF
ncbi:uncharacterized protein LOC133034347 [Cannabis sativa]|uniref:uncharacterized protein LOC133034347 n=1 Tax=Cannabis sativa TaxID=3483 RepID=UPI0029CA5598|nr:uncharacterized protein LOC133034347 [Cannabis sativa]